MCYIKCKDKDKSTKEWEKMCKELEEGEGKNDKTIESEKIKYTS